MDRWQEHASRHQNEVNLAEEPERETDTREYAPPYAPRGARMQAPSLTAAGPDVIFVTRGEGVVHALHFPLPPPTPRNEHNPALPFANATWTTGMCCSCHMYRYYTNVRLDATLGRRDILS